MNKEFINAINDLVKEKGISKEVLIEAIESALVSAYKKNYGTSQNVRVNIDREDGDVDVLMRRDVVDEVEDEFTEISLEEALEIDPRAPGRGRGGIPGDAEGFRPYRGTHVPSR